MFRQLVKHEWRSLTADRGLWIVAALFAALAVYGIANGVAWERFQHEAIDKIAEREAERDVRAKSQLAAIERGELDPTPWTDPRRAATLGGAGHHATLPPGPLTALAVGQSDVAPFRAQVRTWSSERTLWNEYEIENPLNLLAGRFDLAFVLVYLYPLLILALSYNVLSAEREAGTLALVASQPVTVGRVVLGKILFRAAIVVGLALALTIAGVAAGGVDLAADGSATRLLLWLGVTVGYGAFWFSLAVAVNALRLSSATNAVALAACWLVLVVIVPSAVGLAASALHPVPSRAELITSTREAGTNAEKRGSELLAKFYHDHPELAPAGDASTTDFAKVWYNVQRDVDRQVAPVLERFDRQITAQQTLVDRYRYLSPAILAQEAFSEIAGTGTARHREFRRQVSAFNETWRGYFVPRIFKGEPMSAAAIDGYPRFQFVEERAVTVATRVAWGMTGLLAATLLVAIFGAVGLRRYRVAG